MQLLQYPTIANQTLGDGKSMLQYVVDDCPQPLLMSMLLSAPCRINISDGLMRAAITSGKWRIVQLLLEAFSHGGQSSALASNPVAMAALASALELIAAKHPQVIEGLRLGVSSYGGGRVRHR